MKNQVKSCLLCGVGGQGTVLASKMLAFAAMEQGKKVRTAETIGMAQRGGCVVSHVRMGEAAYSPLIPKGRADVLIAFEPAEAVRCLPYLKKDGAVIVSNKAVKPVTAALTESDYDGNGMLRYLKEHVSRIQIVDAAAVCGACGSAKVLNMALLAAAAATGGLGISVEELETAIIKQIPERFHELNLKAVDYMKRENGKGDTQYENE